MKIESTKCYGLFTQHPLNRGVKEANLKHLKEKILKNNHLDANPIIVTDYDRSADTNADTNEEEPMFFIVQGGHRWTIAQELGLDLYYVYKPNLSDDDIRNLNQALAWSQTDWLEFYIKLGNPQYQFANRLMKTYKFPLSPVLLIVSFDKGHQKIPVEFREGKLQAPNMELSTKIAATLRRTLDGIPNALRNQKKILLNRNFVKILVALSCDKNFSLEQFEKKCVQYPHKLTHCPTIKVAAQVLLELYNWNQKVTKYTPSEAIAI